MTSTSGKNARSSAGRLARLVRAVALVVLAAVTAAPAVAQIGGLKKKIKAAAGAPETPDQSAQTGAATGGGGTLVLDDEVLDRLIAGLRAGQAERETAAKEDTPYGRYRQAEAAYAAAKPKCDAAAQTYPQRMLADQKLMEKSNALLEKMVAAQQKQDTTMQRVYADSMLAMQDPSCLVKQPAQPSAWFDAQREVDARAEQQELKVSGFDRRELGSVKDRAEAILKDAPPPDVSQSEQEAVQKRRAELTRAMGLEQVPATRAEKPVPAAAAPPPQPANPGLSPDQQAMNNCMLKNAKKHEKEIARLGERVSAAAESGDTPAAMAIADSIRQLQMAGCT